MAIDYFHNKARQDALQNHFGDDEQFDAARQALTQISVVVADRDGQRRHRIDNDVNAALYKLYVKLEAAMGEDAENAQDAIGQLATHGLDWVAQARNVNKLPGAGYGILENHLEKLVETGVADMRGRSNFRERSGYPRDGGRHFVRG